MSQSSVSQHSSQNTSQHFFQYVRVRVQVPGTILYVGLQVGTCTLGENTAGSSDGADLTFERR